MCGIAGIFDFNGKHRANQESLRPILDSLKHRGFSLFEMASGDGWAMGANRLEIVDPCHGIQPKYSNDKSVTAILNGEIYNYQDIKKQLEAAGYSFLSDSDTEVLANGYHRWGTDIFNRLDGMFAIIIWDKSKNTFIAARDPMGVKPLYYFENDNVFTFASELKALCHQSKQIKSVPPGNFFSRTSEAVQYDHRLPIALGKDVYENATLLRKLIEKSIEKRVRTNLPIAVFMSGGIDSSVILYEACRYHKDVTAFCIGKDGASDVLATKRFCKTFDIKPEMIFISSEELLAVIPDVIWSIESFEPNHIRGGALSYCLSREVANRGYRIALCGEGADELFGGYREFGIAIERGATDQGIQLMLTRFLNELYKTQLQRIDRTGMRFTLEVREPYLDKEILDFAAALPTSHKIALGMGEKVRNKIVLREAYRGILPDWIVDREKVVLSLGAGFDSNGPEGIFYENGMRILTDSELEYMKIKYHDYGITTHEEAYYLKIFLDKFGEIEIAKNRPMVNATSVSA